MADAEESPAQRAARVRREKREKKILEGGSNRLAKITNISGREEDLQPKPPPRPTVANDPGDVDIPHIPAALTAAGDDDDPPTSVPPSDADADLARMRQAFRSQSPGVPADGVPEDPMMALMQQMLGMPGAGGAPRGPPNGAGGAPSQLPPALASLLSGQPMPSGDAQQQQQPAPAGTYIWTAVHAIFALAFGLYLAIVVPFTGSKDARFISVDLVDRQHIFWVFTTVELVLQSSRYMLERGKPQQGGMIATVAGFLPEPYRSYLLLAMRYAGIWTTLVQDVMVAVFVLGTVAWWKGELE